MLSNFAPRCLQIARSLVCLQFLDTEINSLLSRKRFSEPICQLNVRQQGDSKVHCFSSNIVIVSQFGFLVILRYIDHQVYLPLLDEFAGIRREIFQWPVDDYTLDTVASQKLCRPLCRVKPDSKAFEQLCAFNERYLVFKRAGGEQDGSNWELESHRNERFQKCFFKIVSETANLAGGGHFYSHRWVRTVQSRERKLGSFHPDVVQVVPRLLEFTGGDAENRFRSEFNEVQLADF